MDGAYLYLVVHLFLLIYFCLVVFFLGDKLYPLSSSGGAEKITNTNHHLKHPSDSGLHRFLILGSYELKLHITIAPKYNHLLPVVEQALSADLDSQL